MTNRPVVRLFHGFFTMVFIAVCVLFVSLSRLEASKDAPTINELMASGELEREISDQPDAQPPSDTEDDDPIIPSGQAAAPEALSDEDQAPVAAAEQSEPTIKLTPVARVPLADKVVMIGRVPFMNTENMMLAYRGLVSFLKQEMGVKDVRIVTAKDYAGVQNALERGSIDFAWLGPMAYAIASKKLPMYPLAQANRRTGTTYRGVFLTRVDSKILGIEDIKGKVIGFVDPESASGYLYPLYFLQRSKINPHQVCEKVVFLGKHDAIIPAVLEGKIDVGVCLEDTLQVVKDKKILDRLLILGKTYEVPSDIVACRKDCDPKLRDAFQRAMLKTRSLKQTVDPTTGLPPVLEFMPVNDADLNPVREVLSAIDDIRQR